MLKDKTEYVYSVAVYQKYLTHLGEMIIFSPKLENHNKIINSPNLVGHF